MKKVEWNKKHTWKVTKFYDKKGIVAFQYKGQWYTAYPDRTCYEYDDNGEYYIASDGCGHCDLEKYCKINNPIHNACAEFNKCAVTIGHCPPPHKMKDVELDGVKIPYLELYGVR